MKKTTTHARKPRAESPQQRGKRYALEIRNLFSRELIGWSIYPDQIPAMERQLARQLHRTAITHPRTFGHEWSMALARTALTTIGLTRLRSVELRRGKPGSSLLAPSS